MSYERTTKDSVEYIANKFAENPGHFAATILRMYWDMENQRDQYKSERDTLIDDIAVVRANNKSLEEELKRRREEEGNLEAKLSAQLSMKRDLEKENKHLKERINKAEELIEGNTETLKMYGGIISKNYKLEKENKTFLKQMDRQTERIKELKEQNKTSYKPHEVFKLKEENEKLKVNISRLERENKDLFIGELNLQENVNHCLEEVVEITDKYTTLTNHIRLKAEMNPSVDRYIDLVNYIDRLERD